MPSSSKGPPRGPKGSRPSPYKPASPSPPKPPSNWPPEIVFLTHPRLSKSLPPLTISQLSLAPSTSTPHARPNPLVRIRRITSPPHPAFGQFGLFAATTLPARSFVLDYLGYVHDATDVDESSDYDLCLDRELGVGVDAKRAGNEARMVNDYRGVPGFQRPNVVFETKRVGGEHGEVRMGLWVASEDVKKGVELCVSYGKGFWKERLKDEGSVNADSGQPVQES